MYIFLSFLSGITVILSILINSNLANKIGVLKSNRINFFVGLISISLILIFKNQFSKDILLNLNTYPLWIYSGGLIAVLIVSISNTIALKIPTIYLTLIMFIGQLFTSIFIDFLIQNQFSLSKSLGGILIVLGLLYNFRVDRMKNAVKCEAVNS